MILKERAKGFIVGIVLMAVLSGTAVMASPQMREVVFGVRVSHNGTMVSFADDSQPFIMGGRTFLPVRAIADIAGLHVDFVDGVVILSDAPIAPTVAPQPTPAPVPTPAPQSAPILTFYGDTQDVRLDVISTSYHIYNLRFVESTQLYFVTEVRNAGTTPIFLSATSQSFDIETPDGRLLGVVSGFGMSTDPTIIMPGEVSFIHASTSSVTGISLGDSIVIKPNLSPQSSGAPVQGRDVFPTSDIRVESDSQWGVRVFGRVENTSSESQMIRVVALIWDKDGKPLYLHSTIQSSVQPNSTVGFEIRSNSLPPHVTLDRIGRYEVHAYPQFQIMPIR